VRLSRPRVTRYVLRGSALDKVLITGYTKPYVTELDLRLAHIPAGAIDYLREVMPSTPNEAGEREYDYDAWLDSVFE
jgi:hypothetical protein